MRQALLTLAIVLSLVPGAQASSRDPKRPTTQEINDIVKSVPDIYQKGVQAALHKAGNNGRALIQALGAASSVEEKEALAFLIAHMPQRDLRSLDAAYLLENVRYALKARHAAPWGKSIPEAIFLNDVLPYATFNERRDNWRKDFYDRFMNPAAATGTIKDAVLMLNTESFKALQVQYHATKRRKPDQSPYESMQVHYASCTGLTIMLVDLLRAVGIPARAAGIPLWTNKSGNHTWVEVWDEGWHFVGAAEPEEYDKTWFAQQASETDPSRPEHRIYATSFKETGLAFPAIWCPKIHWIPAVDVTERYLKKK